MLSMPSGTDPLIVQRAAREFAQAELVDRRYVMVLHDHQANPHVHIDVRAESRHAHGSGVALEPQRNTQAIRQVLTVVIWNREGPDIRR